MVRMKLKYEISCYRPKIHVSMFIHSEKIFHGIQVISQCITGIKYAIFDFAYYCIFRIRIF